MTGKQNDTNDGDPGKPKRPKRIDAETLDAFTIGWAYHVPLPAFRSALDIRREERRERVRTAEGKQIVRQVWSQGVPPAFNFNVGDIFQAPAIVDERGPQRPTEPSRSVQVQAVSGDEVEIEIIDHPGWARRRARVSQAGLGKLLQDGDLDGLTTQPSSASQAFSPVMLRDA